MRRHISKHGLPGLSGAFRLRWKRRRLLFRIWRKRREIAVVNDRTGQIAPHDILLFATVRNEMLRLPQFLAHYRKLGVQHFLIVDNDSDDGTSAYLAKQPDVSLWTTPQSYRMSRFGMDWLGWLQIKYGHGRWCLTVDADELLVYDGSDRHGLSELTSLLDARGIASLGALMLDLYPKGSLTQQDYAPADDPTSVLLWFDADNYRSRRHSYFGNNWVQGGVRDRVFFASEPERAPSLNKIPLVRWDRRFAYVSSTHQILPRRLHLDYALGADPSAVLLHTKFLPDIAARSAEEMQRGQHFQNSTLYQDYHQSLTKGPDLWHERSEYYDGPEKLVSLGLMSKLDWV